MRFFFTNKDAVLVCFFLIISLILLLLPTGFEKNGAHDSVQCSARVTATDDTNMQQIGMIQSGDQLLELTLLNGAFKGQKLKASNPLMGQLDRDTVYAEGDRVFVVLTIDSKGQIINVSPQGHDRIALEVVLFVIFALLLVLFGGWTGLKTLVSFVFVAICIWKWLVPCLLKGWDPIILTLGTIALMTAAIIFLVAGLNRKGLTAFTGALLGIGTSGIMALYFTSAFHVHGAIMPFAETLLYSSGFGHLDLMRIYVAGVFLACSGAVMDMAMDVSASMAEVKRNNPEVSRRELVQSGINVGRAVAGTMTTTLLFAYSGGYLTLLMAFMAQGVPLANTFNLIYVAAEILKTLIGSIALVTVAPFTALAGGIILTGRQKQVDPGYIQGCTRNDLTSTN